MLKDGSQTATASVPFVQGLTAGGAFAVDSSGNVAITTNKFTVTAASGNTLVAGTLDVNGTDLTFGAASAKIIPGATSLLFRNNGDSASNMVIANAGEISLPLQPAFLATSAGATDVTGNNTDYTVVFGNEIFDQNADFDGISTFTAPVTGRYQFNAKVDLNQTTNATSYALTIVTSNRTYRLREAGVTAGTIGNPVIRSLSCLADMDAADTAVVKIQMTGVGADTADVQSTDTMFSGFLEC